uniref:Chitin-binding type-2 domain-containing protein n=1 Tax=Glossina brevipalpis TaxID=37001 RepID=A0A1A9WBK5_9MUSC
MQTLTFVVLFFAVLAIAQANFIFTGQPGCKTDEEMKVVNYRHFKNKTAYWKCVAKGKPGIFQRCPNTHGYLDDVKACVPWNQWYWTPIVSVPPSSPSYPFELNDEPEVNP